MTQLKVLLTKILAIVPLMTLAACGHSDSVQTRSGIRLFAAQDGDALLVMLVNGTDDSVSINQLFNRFGPAPVIDIRLFSKKGEINKAESADYVNVLIPPAGEGVKMLGVGGVFGHAYQLSDIKEEFGVKEDGCYFVVVTYRDQIYRTTLKSLISNPAPICFR